MDRLTPSKDSQNVFGLLAPSCSPSKITSTPILPKPNLDHLKASATLSTKRQSQKSRLHSRPVDSLLNPDDDAEDREASLRHWKLHFSDASLHSSFLHHTSHPLSPIKALAPQSRVFVRPRIDRASVVSFANTTSSSSSLPLTPQLQQQQQLEPLRQLSPLYDDKSKREYIEQCFDVEMKIGEGSFGEVFQVRSKEDGKHYAVKRSRGAFRGTKDRREKLGEVAKLEKMEPHPNCVQFFLAWEEKKHLYIQTELCMTSLQQFVAMEGVDDRLAETRVWGVLLNLLRAVKHLHDSDLIHFDIKLDNIFVSRLEDGRYICKLGDFGNARNQNSSNLAEAQEGDSKYLAPEILGGVFSKAADVFSLGMTVLEVATGLDPPSHGDGWHLLRSGGQVWRNDPVLSPLLRLVSEDMKCILIRMLDPDPTTRWTIDELLRSRPVKEAVRRQKRKIAFLNFANRIIRFFRLLLFILVAFWDRIVRQPVVVVADSIFKVRLTRNSFASSPSKSQYSTLKPGDAAGSSSRRNSALASQKSGNSISPKESPISQLSPIVNHRFHLRQSSLTPKRSPTALVSTTAAQAAMEDSFSDNDDVFEKHRSNASPSSDRFVDKFTSTSRQLLSSFRKNSTTLGPSSPWNKFNVLTENKDDSNGKQNSSASSSLLAAPLNDSISPQSEKASFKWDQVSADNSGFLGEKDVKDEIGNFDPDSSRLDDRDAAYQGATPPPKRHHPRRPSLQLRESSFLRRDKQKPEQQQITPSHLITESPFKPPLLMSTPRQRSMDLRNDAGLTPFSDDEDDVEFAKFLGDSGQKSVNSVWRERESEAENTSSKRRRRLTIDDDGDRDPLNEHDDDMEVGVLGRVASWEEQESQEEVGIMMMPVTGEISSGVEPKNLMSLFDSVSEDER